MNLCRNCDSNFTSVSGFESHLPPLGELNCHEPAAVGLELKYTPSGKLRGWGFPAQANPYYSKDDSMPDTETVETTLVRYDPENGLVFCAWGKGRPPTSALLGRAEPLPRVPQAAVGQWIDKDGNLYVDRPGAVAKPRKPKPVEAPVLPPVPLFDEMPVPPCSLVLPMPPRLAADEPPPHAEDAFASLYPDDDFLRWESEVVDPGPPPMQVPAPVLATAGLAKRIAPSL